MRYFVSDIHGEYALFARLLEKIQFSSQDELLACGDILEKGDASIRLARQIAALPNVHCIIGNHEYAFLKYYRAMLQTLPDDFDAVLAKLQRYFSGDGHLLDFSLVDWLDSLPAYIEAPDFICVHAGLPTDGAGGVLPVLCASVEELVYDRRFKDPVVGHLGKKCVFFGHTPTHYLCGEPKILGYRKTGVSTPESIADFYKIHLDTGAATVGVLGCFCADTLRATYVKKD